MPKNEQQDSVSPSTTLPSTATSQHERLQHAIQWADKIRQLKIDQGNTTATSNESSIFSPQWYGAPEGLLAATVALAVMLPIRSGILRLLQSQQLHHFPDLILTPLCAMGVAQVGLWVGCLTGARQHLDRVVYTTTRGSTELQAMCSHAPSLQRGSAVTTTQSLWNPQEDALQSLDRALRYCQESSPRKEGE